MKKFLFLSALIFIFIVFPFKETKAYCVWRQIQTLAAPPGQPSQTTTCLGNEAISPATTCGGAVPAHSNCCCDNKQTSQPTWEQTMARIDAAQNGKKPMFTIPNLAIEIPGMASFTQGTCVTGTDGKTNCTVNWIGEYIGGVYKYASGVAGILAVIVLMIGGIIWLISGGDATKIGQSKELIIGSISGLVLLLCSYVILYQINPGLTKFKALTLGYISEFEQLAKARDSGTAEQYKNSPCPTDAELAAGVNFYATGYYKPAWEDSDNFRCVVAMQCSCPNGQDTSKDCDQLYGKNYPGYHPCNSFPASTLYCNKTKSGSEPQIGDIAGPSNCSNLPLNSQVCFKGQTYTIKDAGGGIKGKRIDVWSGTSLKIALSVTGVGILKKGPCN